MTLMKGLEGNLYDEQLKSLGLLSLEETEGRPQFIIYYYDLLLFNIIH